MRILINLSVFLSIFFTTIAGIAQYEFTDTDYKHLRKQMSAHDFTIITMDSTVYEGQLLFINDSVCAVWMDRDSIIDFKRLSSKTVKPIYYYSILNIHQGINSHHIIWGINENINGDYTLFKQNNASIRKKSLYRWFIPEELIDYLEEAGY